MIQLNSLTTITILLAALAVMLKVEESRLTTERSRAAEAMLATTNVVAARDSTRNVALENQKVVHLLGDSLKLVEKRVVQVAQRRDALDQALSRERRASYMMSVTADSLHAVATARTTAIDTSVTRATFAIYQPPYTIHADVVLPSRTDSAQLTVSVTTDPIHLNARLTCSPPDNAGIRTAAIVAASPPWAIVHFDRVEQSPDLCASPALGNTSKPRTFRFPALTLGAGRLLSAGPAAWGLFIGIGTSLGG
jgi:hypothetical protein